MAGKSLIGALRVTLGLDSAEFTKGVESASKQVKRVRKDIEDFGSRMTSVGKMMTMGFSLPLLAAAAAATTGAKEQAQAVAQVEAAITSMGNAAGRSSKQLAEAADAMEMNSLFNADVILTKVTANLLTFGNVAGEVFDRAQQAAIDMAQRMGGDPQAAALLLGKALNDPIKGMAALGRVGVQLSATQKEQIKSFMATGNAAKAQAIILGEVERQFKGAAKAAADTTPWRQAQVAIDQTMDKFGEIILPMLPQISAAVIGIAQAIGSLSPEMQQVVVVAGLVAAAFGPVLVAIGTVATTIVARVVPALIALRAGLLATAAAGGTGAVAAGRLAAALRLLMIATPVLAAVAALAGGIYLLSNRSREATAAERARELQALRTSASLDIEQRASEQLAAAQGRERAATLDAMQASRQRAAASLASAAAKIKDARASLALARAESNRRIAAATQSSRGAGGGTDPAMVEIYRAKRVIDPAAEMLKDAEEKYAKGMGMLDGLDKAIREHTPINLPPIDVPALDAGAAAAGRAGNAVKGIGDEAKSAKEKAQELQSLLDRLFPEVAARREYEAQLKLIEESKMTEQQRAEAIRALRREYAGLHRDMIATAAGDDRYPGIETVEGTKSIEEVSADISNAASGALDRVKKNADDMRVRVIESFSQMVDGALGQIDRMVKGIKSGNILDIIGGLLNAIDKIAGIATGGKGWNVGPFSFGGGGSGTPGYGGGIPGFASGGSMRLGGIAGVDRNLLSMNGRPLARVSAGEWLDITPANSRGGGRVVYFDNRGAVMTEDLLNQMNGMVASGIAKAAPHIASAGAQQALGVARRQQARSLAR